MPLSPEANLSKPTIQDVENLIREKYVRGEAWFRSGQMRTAVEDLYTDDLYYLAPDLSVIQGRAALIAYFESVRTIIAQVHIQPVLTWGDPARVVYQFCNTERHSPQDGAISRAHYIAAFRQVQGDWLIEMEVPALGHVVLPPSAIP
jgi:ketosteroid isomerase-like protein